MSRVISLLLLAVFVVVSRPISAQSDKPECDPAGILKKAASLVTSGDKGKDMEALIALRDEISAANVACNGWTWKGEGVKVVGPVLLTKALYKVTAKSSGYLTVFARSVEGGNCKAGVVQNLFTLDDKEAKLGAETILDISNDCRLVLLMSNTSTAWTVAIEPLS
jgi:hypothetical protein